MAAWSGVNSYTGQGSVGQYKDIKDALFYIEGNEAPIQKIAKYTKAKGPTTHYWEELAYTNNTANAEQKTEGQDLTADTPPTKAERYNFIEENAETYYVSNKVDAASKAGAFAGIKDYIRESKKQAMIELKGKLEASLLLLVKGMWVLTVQPDTRQNERAYDYGSWLWFNRLYSIRLFCNN